MVDAQTLLSVLDQRAEVAELAWPAFRLDRAMFRARVLAALDLGGGVLADPQEIHVADLYLACACAAGIPGALTEFSTRYLEQLHVRLKRFGDSIRPEDARREIEDILLFGRKDAPPRIGQYQGRGPLQGFVATAIRNVAISMIRAQNRERWDDFDALASQLAGTAAGSATLVTARYQRAVEEALHAALLTLDLRQRTIVRLHMGQGVTLSQIARMLKVHQTTVSRSLDAALKGIYRELRENLRHLGLNSSEMRSIVEDVRSRIDLSLSRTLHETRGG